MESLSALEQAVLDKLLAGNHPTLITLRDQAAQARLTSRELSGVGFFCNFEVPLAAPHVRGNLRIGDVYAEVSGLEFGVGFVLFVSDGRLQMLEGFTYGEPWPQQVTEFKLRYISDPSSSEVIGMRMAEF